MNQLTQPLMQKTQLLLISWDNAASVLKALLIQNHFL